MALSIDSGKDGEDQDERNHEFHTESLSRGDLIQTIRTQSWPPVFRAYSVQDSCTDDCPDTLGNDVENSAYDGDLTGDHETDGDRWVDVAAADMSDGPNDRGHGQSKCKGDLDDPLRRHFAGLGPVDRWATCKKHQ